MSLLGCLMTNFMDFGPLYVTILMFPDYLQISRTLVIIFATVVYHCRGLNSCCVSSGVSEIIIFTNVLFWISSLPSNLFLKVAMCFVCFKSLVTKKSSFCWTATCSFIVRSPVARFSSRQPSSVLLLRIPPLGMRFPLCCSVWSCLGFNVTSDED